MESKTMHKDKEGDRKYESAETSLMQKDVLPSHKL